MLKVFWCILKDINSKRPITFLIFSPFLSEICSYILSLCIHDNYTQFRIVYVYNLIPDTPLVIRPPLCRVLFLWKDVLTFYINILKITHLAKNVKYFSYSLDDSFSQLSKEVRLLCWDSRKSKQRKWSDVFQKIQVDINFILICGTKLRTFKQKVRPQWILLWCIFMWKKLGTHLSTPWKIYLGHSVHICLIIFLHRWLIISN